MSNSKDATQSPDEPRRPVPLQQLLRAVIDGLAPEPAHAPQAVRSGLAALDAVTGGVWPGSMWAVTGPMGVGKSVLVLDLARAALRQGVPTAVLTRSEPAEHVVHRLLAADAQIPLLHLQQRSLTDEDWAKLARQAGALVDAPLVLRSGPLPSPEALPSLLAPVRTAGTQAPGLVVLDDLPADDEQMSVLAALSATALTHGVAVVVAVQQRVEQAETQERRVSQVADLVLRIHRGDQWAVDRSAAAEAALTVVRNRRGPVTTATVAFQGQYARFTDPT